MRDLPKAATDRAGTLLKDGAEWGISSTNRKVRTYQITAAGLRHLEKQITSFERMFEGITLVLSPSKSSV